VKIAIRFNGRSGPELAVKVNGKPLYTKCKSEPKHRTLHEIKMSLKKTGNSAAFQEVKEMLTEHYF